MRRTADTDQGFWSKPGDGGSAWMDDLGSDATPDAETRALDDLALGHGPTDRVFHELRDLATAEPDIEPAGAVVESVVNDPTVASSAAAGAPGDEPPPAASSSSFSMDAVSDDLLPSWNLDLS